MSVVIPNCGIDLGWRLLADGSIRVSWVTGSDGHDEPFNLPVSIVSHFRHAQDIQGIRDNLFDTAKAQLSTFLTTPDLPQWLTEAAATLPQWKSKGRLASLVSAWQRFPGDEKIFPALCQWRDRDVHLWQYETGTRQKGIRKRLQHYRQFAASIRKRYDRIAIEKIDWSSLAALPQPEDAEAVNRTAARNRTIASVGELASCLKSNGASEVPAENTTRTCHLCSHLNDWDQSVLVHTCSSCSATWDQDQNAGHNLLNLCDLTKPHKTAKVKVYKYKGKRPTQSEDQINTQISLAHRYYNKLVEIRNSELAKVLEAQSQSAPSISVLQAEIDAAIAAIAAIRDSISAQNSATRKLTRSAADREAISSHRTAITTAVERIRQEKSLLSDNPSYQSSLTKINAASALARKAAYAEVRASGVHWGTVLKYSASAEQAQESNPGPLTFRRWNGNGLIAVQLQNGASPSQLESGADTRIQLHPISSHPRQRLLWLRIGSIGRAPIWAKIPIHYHRPLPPDCKIMWVVLTRRQRAVRRDSTGTFVPYYEWEANFTIRLASGEVVKEGATSEASDPATPNGRWGKRKAKRSRESTEVVG